MCCFGSSGYHEIQHPPERYSLIDREALMKLCGISSSEQLSITHRQWIEEALGAKEYQTREDGWSESIAVGSPQFLEGIKGRLRKARNREISSVQSICILREPPALYSTIFDHINDALILENAYLWND